MLKLVKQCAPWLNWKVAGVIAVLIVGVLLCTGLPTLSVLAGVAPLLLLIACLVPCLVPLVRNKRRG